MRLRPLLVSLFLGFALAAANAAAEPPGASPVPAEPAASAPAAEPEARPARRRLTTLERWRGRPYLRAQEEEARGGRLRTQLFPARGELGAVFSRQ